MKKKENLAHPHDMLFKAAFGNKDVIKDLLEIKLPKKTLAIIDLDSLKRESECFVSRAGKQTHSDLVYSVRLRNRPGYACLVIEHFSTSKTDIPLRQMEYNVALFRQHLKQGKTKLPLTFNVCVYSGKSKRAFSATFVGFFEYPDLVEKYGPENCVIDFQEDREEQIAMYRKASVAGMFLKQNRKEDIYTMLEKYGYLFQKEEIPYLEEAIIYILDCESDEKTLEKLQEITDPKYKNVVMSIVQKLEKRGMEKGMEKEKLGIARNMLRAGSDTGFIEKMTGLDRGVIGTLQIS